MEKLSVLKIAVSIGAYKDFLEKIISDAIAKRSGYICVANVHMLMEAHSDPSFADVLKKANVITPDGMPLTWAMRLLYNIRQDRVAGMDLLPDILERASKSKLSIYFYGGTEEMLQKTKEYLTVRYHGITLAGM